jgi:hypothetical protein
MILLIVRPHKLIRVSEGLIFNQMTHNCKHFNKCGNTVERISNIRKDNFFVCFNCRQERVSKYERARYPKDTKEKKRISKLHCENMINYWTTKLKALK